MIFKNTWLYRQYDTVKGRIVFHENNKNKVLTENRKANIDKEGLFVAFSGLKSVAKLSSYDKVLIDRKTYRRSGEKTTQQQIYKGGGHFHSAFLTYRGS